MKQLLILYHSQTGNTRRLAEAVRQGAVDSGENISIKYKTLQQASAKDLLDCDGVIFGTPENFGYMCGELKAFFDRTYNIVREQTAGKPYALFISCDNDGRGAEASVNKIMLGYSMVLVLEALVCRGEVADDDLRKAYELGQYVAISLSTGII